MCLLPPKGNRSINYSAVLYTRQKQNSSGLTNSLIHHTIMFKNMLLFDPLTNKVGERGQNTKISNVVQSR